MTKQTLKSAALKYAEEGYYVFPLEPKGKKPLTSNGFKDASRDPEQIKKWWFLTPNANIGLVTGPLNKLFVIDLDCEKPDNFPISSPPTAYTSKGTHYYVTLPEDMSIKNQTKIKGKDIDVRGDGGYVVAPPSIHASGKEYKFHDHLQLTKCTNKILDFIIQSKDKDYTPQAIHEKLPIGFSDKHLAESKASLKDALLFLPNDYGYDDWVRLTAAYKAGVGGDEAYYTAYEEWGLRWPDNTKETVREKWNSITETAAGAGTIFYEARKRGWREPRVYSKSSPHLTAIGIIEDRFEHENSQTLVHLDQFYIWEGGHYKAMHHDQLNQIISEELEQASQMGTKDGEKNPFNPKRTDISEVSSALQNKIHIERKENLTAPFWINEKKKPSASNLLCFNNGLLNTSSLELAPHDPNLFITSSLPYSFMPDAPKPKVWLNFLESIWGDDPECIECLQMWMGYLVCNAQSHHKILLITGPTRSGKGTISHIIRELLGQDNVVSPRIASFGRFGLEPLIGKRAALINDARPPKDGTGLRNIVEALLTISGGDNVSIERKHKQNWNGVLPTCFTLFTNEIPGALQDPSNALAQRLIHLRMQKSFLGKEDLQLKEKLKQEIPSIFNWALNGYKKLLKQRYFKQPKSGFDGLQEFQNASNPLTEFIEDYCELSASASILTQDLRDRFHSVYPESNLTAQGFGYYLMALHPSINKKSTANGKLYLGIQLKNKTIVLDDML